MEDKIWYLKQINILKCLTDKELMTLGSQCSMIRYKRGDQVYLPQTTPNIYFIKSGGVKLVSVTSDGTEMVKDVIAEGEIFGKFFGVDMNEQEQMIALEDCMICYLPFTDWQIFIKDNPALNLSFIKWIGLRIKRIERKMDSLYFKTSRQRIVETLIEMGKRLGKRDSSNNIIIKLDLKHNELAQLTGSSRQFVNTFLNELRQKKLIDYTRSTFILKESFINDENGSFSN